MCVWINSTYIDCGHMTRKYVECLVKIHSRPKRPACRPPRQVFLKSELDGKICPDCRRARNAEIRTYVKFKTIEPNSKNDGVMPQSLQASSSSGQEYSPSAELAEQPAKKQDSLMAQPEQMGLNLYGQSIYSSAPAVRNDPQTQAYTPTPIVMQQPENMTHHLSSSGRHTEVRTASAEAMDDGDALAMDFSMLTTSHMLRGSTNLTETASWYPSPFGANRDAFHFDLNGMSFDTPTDDQSEGQAAYQLAPFNSDPQSSATHNGTVTTSSSTDTQHVADANASGGYYYEHQTADDFGHGMD